MKNSIKTIIIFCTIGILFIVFLVFSALSKRIPSNDISVVGNTAGNHLNGGLFCESDGKVYFSNPYDGGCLYSMNVDETDMKKLNETQVSCINAGGKYLYYYLDSSAGGEGLGYVIRTYGIYRSKKGGSDTTCLKKEAATAIQLVGDYLYYQDYNTTDYTQLYKMKTDKSSDIMLADYIINPSSVANGIIYYNGTQRDHYLYALDTRTDSISTVWEENLWNPVYLNDYVYFMDVSSNYRLCRYSIAQDVVEVLTDERIDTYNVTDSYIYYQVSSETAPALKRMYLDGSSQEIVAEGVYNSINCTSAYVYFTQFGEDIPVYRTPAAGPVMVSTFDTARDAAMAQ